MKRLILNIISLFFITNILYSQVLVNGNIKFTNPNDSLRNIYNLATPDSLNNAVRYNEYVYQKYFENEVTVSDSLFVINTPFEFPPYTNGMNIILSIPSLLDSINTPTYLKINQFDPIIITKINNDTLENTDLTSNRILVLLYNNNTFTAVNCIQNKCVTGYKNMKNKYCIQKGRYPAANFFVATKTCNDLGYHLCTLQEWYYACVNNSGINYLPSNFEWVHSACNHNTGALKIGSTTCTNTGSDTAETYSYYYRCCYNLK